MNSEPESQNPEERSSLEPFANSHPRAAELLLRLYEIRREADLRKARRWYDTVFRAMPFEEWAEKNPPGSEGDRYFRMVVGHWQMVAVLWKYGYLPGDLLFATTREFRRVWERCADFVEERREAGLGARYLREFEEMCDAFDVWLSAEG